MEKIKKYIEDEIKDSDNFMEYIDKNGEWAIPINAEPVKPILREWGRVMDPEGYNPISFVHNIVVTGEGIRNYTISIFTDNSEKLLADTSEGVNGIDVLRALLEEKFEHRKYKINVHEAGCYVI